MVLFHGVTCEQPPTGYVRVSVVVWFWGHRSHVVKRIYPSRSGVDGPDVALWDAQFARLEAYKAAHGDCDVPHRWVEDQALANWVRKQRTKKTFDRDGSGTTPSRVARLTELGFAWAWGRGSKRKVWSTLCKPQTPVV